MNATEPTTLTKNVPRTAVLRPWGWYDSIGFSAGVAGYQVKRIHVHAGQSLSLQSHEHRSEHWVVVQGMATILVGADLKQVQSRDCGVGEHIFISHKAIHRLSNNTAAPVEIIEVQCGSYLGEDDIVRYEDVYGRS